LVSGPPIGNDIRRVEQSRDRRRQVVTSTRFEPNISKTGGDAN